MSEVSNEKARRHHRGRMTAAERREQLLSIARRLFAERGFDGTSIEEVAARAEVSKPVVYEHFGGKEGLYAVVVDREVRSLLDMMTRALTAGHPRVLLEQAALALLDYIEQNPDGFKPQTYVVVVDPSGDSVEVPPMERASYNLLNEATKDKQRPKFMVLRK